MKVKLYSVLMAAMMSCSAIAVQAQEPEYPQTDSAQTEFVETNPDETSSFEETEDKTDEPGEAEFEQNEPQDFESSSAEANELREPDDENIPEAGVVFKLPDGSKNQTLYEYKLHLNTLESLKKQFPDQAKVIDQSIDQTKKAMAKLETVAMHRLYNPNSGEHFYTADAKERDHLISVGWKGEGVGWYAPKNTGDPVYRVYNKNGGEHHYTLSKHEKDALVQAGWKDEGIGWKSMDKNNINAVPVYRQYNPNNFSCNHNYSTSSNEERALFEIGWLLEGTGWYGVFPYSKVQSTVDKKTVTKVYDANSMKQLSGWQTILGDSYYFNPDKDGAMQMEEAVLPGMKKGEASRRYYFDEKGRQAVGLVALSTFKKDSTLDSSGKLIYVDRKTGALVKNKEMVLPSLYYSGDKTLYYSNEKGECQELQIDYVLGSSEPVACFKNTFPWKTIDLYDLVKKLGLNERAQKMMNVGIKYRGWKYVWGGREPSAGGFDCSGLVTYCIRQGLGKNIYATAEDLYNKHVDHISYKDVQPGDLFFNYGDYNGRKNYIYHVGIYLGNGWAYHSAGTVHFIHCGVYPDGLYGRIR